MVLMMELLVMVVDGGGSCGIVGGGVGIRIGDCVLS